MVISHKHRFIYFAPMKTGSSTIALALQHWLEAKPLGFPGACAPTHDIYMPREYADYYTFVTVRNPYTRFISAYNYFSREGESMRGWIDRHFIRPITEELFFKPLPTNVDAVRIKIDTFLRLETLSEDFHKLPFAEPHIHIGCLNPARVKKTFELTEKDIKWMKNLYKNDFDVFGYDPDDYGPLRSITYL